MLQFYYPIAFLAAAVLIIPVLIHLWNVKTGKTIKIGSIALLGESAQQSSKSFKITDWLLLILRCLLLLLLICILAKPFYVQPRVSAKQKGWILVNASALPDVYKRNAQEIKTLLAKGFELHDFAPAFKTIPLKDTLSNIKPIADSIPATELLKQLNQLLPNQSTVYLYANKRLANFGNEIPKLNYVLYWKAAPVDSASWITEFSDKKYKATSNAQTTRYDVLKTTQNPQIKVLIYQQPGVNDAHYLVAALQSIAAFSKRDVQIQYAPSGTANAFDVGFWLAESNPSPTFIKQIKTNGTYLRYAQGKVLNDRSTIATGNAAAGVELYKRIEIKPDGATPIWTDGFGDPLLTTQKVNQKTEYHFYSHFSPQWNELVWKAQFVKYLMPIVLNQTANDDFGFEESVNDQRTFAKNEKESIYEAKASKSSVNRQHVPLIWPFWIAAFLVLSMERILSFRKKTTGYVKH